MAEGEAEENPYADDWASFLREVCLGFSETGTHTTFKGHVCILSNAYVLPEVVSFVASSNFCCMHPLTIFSATLSFMPAPDIGQQNPFKNRGTGEMHPFVFPCGFFVCFVTVWGCLSCGFPSQRLLIFPQRNLLS